MISEQLKNALDVQLPLERNDALYWLKTTLRIRLKECSDASVQHATEPTRNDAAFHAVHDEMGFLMSVIEWIERS